jgi:hypothetical protein
MAGKSDPKTRASQLRQRMAKQQAPARAEGPGDRVPQPGESPNAYVERRMRDTLKKDKSLTGRDRRR